VYHILRDYGNGHHEDECGVRITCEVVSLDSRPDGFEVLYRGAVGLVDALAEL
jgi:hypothetical protein